MTILTMNRKELEKKVGKIDEKMQETITNMGTPIEEVTEEEVSVEVFPNRPDLLSLSNFARTLNQYRGKRKLDEFKIHDPEKNFSVTIDKSVKKVRPYTVCCIVKGLSFNDEKIKEIIDIQEKLHGSLGRKRKKAAIGIYPLEKITLPITFKAMDPNEIKFQPLEYPKGITGKQILSKHPTGREYGDLLKGYETFPIFVDANNEVLSMPPIINSEKTGRITTDTKEVFIECSGSNKYYLEKCLAIIVSALFEMGGKIYAMNIIDKKEKNSITPQMESEKMSFAIEDINKNLGLELTEKEVKKLLEKMGIGTTTEKNKHYALIPPYRSDILHWIDLVEEVAIAYGYDNFEPIIPQIATIGDESQFSKIKKVLINILTDVGLLECSSYHLTTKKNIKKIYFEFNECLEVEDSKNERDVLRYDLLTNLLQIISQNSDSVYPQKIFEIGTVFEKDTTKETKIKETQKLGVAMIDETITFTDVKQVVDYLFKMLDIEYTIKEYDEHPGFIAGRCAYIIVNNKEVGYIGEIAPRVLKNWKIKAPVAACEIDINALLSN